MNHTPVPPTTTKQEATTMTTIGPWKPQASPNHTGLWETIDKRTGYLGQSFYQHERAVEWCEQQNERELLRSGARVIEVLRQLVDTSWPAGTDSTGARNRAVREALIDRARLVLHDATGN